jgi:hypothetical protein
LAISFNSFMIRFRFLLPFLLLAVVVAHAKYIPDPIVRYKIDARLDPAAKTVTGHEIIVWRNHTTDAIPDLQFHLYLNAFKNSYTTFMREGHGHHRESRFRGRPNEWGYEQISSLNVDGQDLTAGMRFIQPDDGNYYDQTVLEVPLPKPIPAGASVTIEIAWTSKLPRVFARTGFQDNFFLVGQWFPKPGVYEAKGERHRAQGGWNCHQFHANTEFYADYGTWDVTLTVPSDFEIAATGALRHEHTQTDGTTVHNFYQEDVHEFAWAAQPRSQVLKIERRFKADEQVSPAEIDEWSRKTGAPPEEVKLQDVNVTLFIQREHRDQIERHYRAAFEAIKWFGLMYGKYPYDVLTVVDPPYGGLGAAGMEYPTFITAGTSYWPGAHKLSPEYVTVHEFGHQFWYGLVGNNEFEEAWLDEGFTSYSTGKVLERAYGPDYQYEQVFGVPIPTQPWLDLPIPRYPWKGIGNLPLGQYWEWVPLGESYGRAKIYAEDAQDDAMERYAWLDLNIDSYRVQAYAKPELTLRTLEALLGDAWPKVIRTYQQRWRFKHPDAIDFTGTVREVSGQDMKWFFDQTVYGTGMLNYSVSFTSGETPFQRGWFDDASGKPQPALPPEESPPHRPIESEVRVRRLGEMQFPVTVLVRFEDGSEVREHWDGQYRWTKFKYTGKPKIVSAQIDPDFQWKLEVQRTDDSYQAQPVRLAADKWYLRWVIWIENVLMAFSFFS